MTRRKLEAIGQTQGENLIRSIGGKAYHLSQPRATMQTEGLADELLFLPVPKLPPRVVKKRMAFWEAKRPAVVVNGRVVSRAGTLSHDQEIFMGWCQLCDVEYITGGLDALILFLCDGGWLDPKNLAHYRNPYPEGVAR